MAQAMTQAIPSRNESLAWNTRDIMVVAVIGVVFGVINAGFGMIYQLGIAAFGPIWTSIFIPFQIGKVLAMYIVRKPGAALANGLITGVVEFLSGNPGGLLTLFWGAAQGIGVELPFLLTRYRGFGIWPCVLAGGLASVFSKVISVIAYGWAALGWQFLTFLWILGFVVSAIENGFVGYGLGRVLKRTGLLRSFRGGADPVAA